MNYIRITAIVGSYIAFIMLGSTNLLWAQTGLDQRLLQIQQDHQEGKLGPDAAVLQQFHLLFDSDENTSSRKEKFKCATPAFVFLHQHEKEISAETRNEINKLTKPDQQYKSKRMQEIYISDSGLFEIHYDTTGSDSISSDDENENGIPDYVEWVSEAADSSYRHLVQNIGFVDPIPEGSRYEIYFEDMSAYGYTQSKSGTGTRSHIVVENDFDGFPLNTDPEGIQIGSIKATVAHEFKHAIQFEQDLGFSWSLNWSEMDATLMEEVVYDDVNDYYNYIKNGWSSSNPHLNSVFGGPQRSAPGVGYNFVTWMLYYSEAFGNDLWRAAWELIEADELDGIDEALVDLLPAPGIEMDFESTFVQNHLWHFASGSRSGDDTYGFDEKEDYPNAQMEHSFTSAPLEEVEMSTISKLAARYFEIIPSTSDQGLIEVAVDFDSTQVGVGVLYYMKSGEILESITTGEDKAQVYVPSEIAWTEIERLGVVVANPALFSSTRNLTLNVGKDGNPVTIRDPAYTDLPEKLAVFQNYPNPFNPRTIISFELPQSAFVELEVYDISGRKVHTLVSENRRFGRYEEIFDGSALASGVYLYRLRIDDEVFIKKMALIK